MWANEKEEKKKQKAKRKKTLFLTRIICVDIKPQRHEY